MGSLALRIMLLDKDQMITLLRLPDIQNYSPPTCCPFSAASKIRQLTLQSPNKAFLGSTENTTYLVMLDLKHPTVPDSSIPFFPLRATMHLCGKRLFFNHSPRSSSDVPKPRGEDCQQHKVSSKSTQKSW